MLYKIEPILIYDRSNSASLQMQSLKDLMLNTFISTKLLS